MICPEERGAKRVRFHGVQGIILWPPEAGFRSSYFVSVSYQKTNESWDSMTGSGFNKSVTIPKDQMHGVEFRPLPAVVLAPALGYPAMVRRRADGSAWLEMMILTKKSQISPAEVAFHVRLVPWKVKDQPTRYTSKRLNIFQSYIHESRKRGPCRSPRQGVPMLPMERG